MPTEGIRSGALLTLEVLQEVCDRAMEPRHFYGAYHTIYTEYLNQLLKDAAIFGQGSWYIRPIPQFKRVKIKGTLP